MADVVLVRWPEDAADGARLANDGIAVLYLVTGDDAPPVPETCLEDWVRMPGDERDLSARVAALEMRSAAHDSPPVVDDHGRLHYRGRLLTLQPSEARLAQVLVERFGDVVTDGELDALIADVGDGDPAPSMRLQMAQLRTQLRAAGLSLNRIRRRGYKLQRR